MNSRELEDLMRRARPTRGPSSYLDRARNELLEEIMSSPAERTVDVTTDMTPKQPRRPLPLRRRWLVGAAAAVALALAVPVWFSGGEEEAIVQPSARASVSEPTLSTSGNPHLFMDSPWLLTSLYQGSAQDGSQTFTRSSRTIETTTVQWFPIKVKDRILKARQGSMVEQDPMHLFGSQATVLSGPWTYEALITSGQTLISIRVYGIADLDAFRAALSDLQVLEPQQWEDALGDDMVRPEGSVEVAEQMLRGVPLPDGFDTATLASQFAQDRYQFGSHVLTEVSCSWLQVYAKARTDQDEESMAVVEAALASHTQWDLQREMSQRPEYLDTQLSQASGTVSARRDVSAHLKTLGCDASGS